MGMMNAKGRDDLLIKRITNTLESYTIPDSVTSIGDGAFAGCSNLQSITFPQNIVLDGVVSSSIGIFAKSGLTSVHLHTATINGYSAFRNCQSLTTFVGERLILGSSIYYLLYDCKNLLVFDADINELRAEALGNCTKLQTIILRKSDALTPLLQTGVFNNTPFKNGGTGGTIYIPKVLYDHLGDGTSLDYKAASNWSTVDGYGTITWAKIEGSIYETQYADGTPIQQ